MDGKKFIEIKKPVEIVQELKGDEYQIPSFEEFMKTYENDGSLNYDDLSDGSVSEVKGYGPCHSCGNRNLQFRLQITLTKWDGGGITATVFSTEEAERAAREIREGTGFWEGTFKTGPFTDSSRHALAYKVMNQVDIHKNGRSVDEDVSYKDSFHPCSIM